MKPDPQPLRHTTQQEVEATQSVDALQHTTEVHYENPEALLRQDRAQTAVPDSLAQRLAAQVASTPSSAKPWWRRWL